MCFDEVDKCCSTHSSVAVSGMLKGISVSPLSLQSTMPSVHKHSAGHVGGTVHSTGCVEASEPVTHKQIYIR